ncbi:MAG: hypothetical protein ABL966_06335 [Acidimicrobiales bacterium]
MLGYERKVVAALSTTTDPAKRAAVVAWVDGSLAAMPELLRAGVAVGSVVLGAWARVMRKDGAALVRALEASPLPPVRLHLRLLRSLVLFGDLELSPGARP